MPCPWVGGLSLPKGGGGQTPPPKKAQLTRPPKTGPGMSVVRMPVVFVFQDTRPPVNSGYMYVAPHHGLPLEPHELVRVKVAIRVAGTAKVGVRVGIKVGVGVRARATARGEGEGGARRARAIGVGRLDT